jgi:hypothetical protein
LGCLPQRTLGRGAQEHHRQVTKAPFITFLSASVEFC